jgi:hypothetical protein
MKLAAIISILILTLVGCTEEIHPPGQQNTDSSVAPQVSSSPARDHNYDFVDGMEYGYTLASTEADEQNGVATNDITMFKYAGNKDGLHQLHTNQGPLLISIECAHPCNVAKIMSVMDLSHEIEAPVIVERTRLKENSIAALALEDAAKGKLKSYYREVNGKKYSAWVMQEKGIILTRQY